MNFEEKVLKFIEENNLFARRHKLLVAFSGGIDSTTLLFFLKKQGYNVFAAHINYKLRKEADKDEEFCRNFCKKLNITFHSKQVNTKSLAGESKKSIQEIAREIRYNFFYELLEKCNYDFILTAHHKNDLLETAFFSLIKSKHYNILQTIPAKNNKIRRPFLCVYRKEIEEYARQNNIEFVQDISNFTDKYDRNKIRLNIFPEIMKLNPNFYNSLSERLEFYNNQLDVLNYYLDKEFSGAIIWEGSIIKIDLSEGNKKGWELYVIKELNRILGFSTNEVKKLLELKNKITGKTQKNRNFVAYKDRKYITLQPVETLTIEEDLPVSSEFIFGEFLFHYEQLGYIPEDYKKNHPQKFYFDVGKISGDLRIRYWRQGDRFKPLGLKGSKLVSDILTDKKVPTYLRKKYFVIYDNEGIIYLQGYRIADKVKITQATKTVGKISWENIKMNRNV